VRFSRKRQDGFAPHFFQGLGENTCLLQPALKSNALGLLSFCQNDVVIATPTEVQYNKYFILVN